MASDLDIDEGAARQIAADFSRLGRLFDTAVHVVSLRAVAATGAAGGSGKLLRATGVRRRPLPSRTRI